MLGFRDLTASLVALCAIASPAAAAETEHATIALPAIAAIFSSIYIAQDADIYKDVGLDVKEQVIQGIGSANAVIAGSIDFSSSSGVTLTRAVARHQAVVGIANTFERSGFWIVITKKVADERHFDPKAPLAERAKLMKGLRFSVGAIQAIPDAYAKVIARMGGLDPDKDIVRSGIPPRETLGAMKTGSIDGASIGPPVLEELQKDNFAVVLADGTTCTDADDPRACNFSSAVAVRLTLSARTTSLTSLVQLRNYAP